MSLPQGWCSDAEANELQRLATGKTVLELGAWKGRSTVVLAEVATYVVSVDRHHGIEEAGGEDSLPDYLDAVRRLPNVAIVVASFDRFCPLLREEFDLVYVDGNHDEASVFDDCELAIDCVKDDGMIVFHDWDFETVRQGVRRCLGDEPGSLVGSVAAFLL